MLIDVAPNSEGNTFRGRRFEWFLELLSRLPRKQGRLEILDVGGTADYWRSRLDKINGEYRITLVNRMLTQTNDPRLKVTVGDARHMPQFADNSFDVVHSNSVIEHVGRWQDMQAMASEVRRLAPAHFVQTPNFWFPIEPHARTAFLHWLPRPLRIKLFMKRSLGFFPKCETVDQAMHFVEDSILLDASCFRYLFPDSEIRREKVAGLTKSLIAVRGG